MFAGQVSDNDYRFTLGATVPIMTLCPCSKEIADRGAHSQRAQLTVRLRSSGDFIIWLEDLVPLIRSWHCAPLPK